VRVSGLILTRHLPSHGCLQAKDPSIHHHWSYCITLVAHPRHRFPCWRVRYLGTASPPPFDPAQQLPPDDWVSSRYLVTALGLTQPLRVMSILLPTALFSALDRNTTAAQTTTLVSDELRAQFLHFSRGTAVILLFMYVSTPLSTSVRRSPSSSYICSRIFLHNPPGEDNALQLHPTAPKALKEEERKLAEEEPEANSWVCLGAIIITIALMAVTAEFLVESIESVREQGTISEEYVQRCRHEALLINMFFRWFGLILLPLVSFAADGAVATVCEPSSSLKFVPF